MNNMIQRLVTYKIEPLWVHERVIDGSLYTSAVSFQQLKVDLKKLSCMPVEFVTYVETQINNKRVLFDETQFKDDLLPGDYTYPLRVVIRAINDHESKCVINGPFGPLTL